MVEVPTSPRDHEHILDKVTPRAHTVVETIAIMAQINSHDADHKPPKNNGGILGISLRKWPMIHTEK